MNLPLIRERIRTIRNQKNLRAQDMAKALGISRPFFTQLETGTRTLSVERFLRIAETLHVSVGVLCGEAPLPQVGAASPSEQPKHLKEISFNRRKITSRLKPILGKETEDAVACLEMWPKAPEELKRSLKVFREDKDNKEAAA